MLNQYPASYTPHSNPPAMSNNTSLPVETLDAIIEGHLRESDFLSLQNMSGRVSNPTLRVPQLNYSGRTMEAFCRVLRVWSPLERLELCLETDFASHHLLLDIMLSTLRGLHELDYGGPHLDLSSIATLPCLQKVSFYSDRYTGPEDENNIRSNQEDQEKFSALHSITYTGMNR